MQNAYQNYHKGNVDFMKSRTRENLMRSFAGESQARNRYTIAASAARHNEYQEFEHDYAQFAKTAHNEGFDLIGGQFELIAQIEKTHGDRFGLLADLLERGALFGEDNHQTVWMCLNCGEIITSSLAPQVCPVCRHGQDFFVRLDWAPYTAGR